MGFPLEYIMFHNSARAHACARAHTYTHRVVVHWEGGKLNVDTLRGAWGKAWYGRSFSLSLESGAESEGSCGVKQTRSEASGHRTFLEMSLKYSEAKYTLTASCCCCGPLRETVLSGLTILRKFWFIFLPVFLTFFFFGCQFSP